MTKYYTQNGQKIRNPEAYAKTGAPMYLTKNMDSKDINEQTTIYKMELENGKKYIGKTGDIFRRMDQHFSGNGAKVTQKFKPIEGRMIDEVPGYFSNEAEQEYTEKYIDKYGYDNVRGGNYTNSKTLQKTYKSNKITCFKCGKNGHYANQCYISYDDDDDDDEDDDDY